MDGRSTPSIYVGETSRSISERASEHWADWLGKEEDSHIYKHWQLHHGGVGDPIFEFKVIRFCRDALSRQVGESTRITLRGNCLNSKAGYNRSGISRLTLKPEDEQHQENTNSKHSSRGRESQEEDGLQIMAKRVQERAKGVGKRVCAEDDPLRKAKRRKKLKHQVLNQDWGLMDGELKELENLEIARTRFLNSGPGDCIVGAGKTQTTIKIWSENELIARQLVRECVGMAIDGIQNCIEVLREEQTEIENNKIQKNNKTTKCKIQMNTVETLPEGWQTDVATASPIQPKLPVSCKASENNSITKYFRNMEAIRFDEAMQELEKERRLEIKRVKELAWRDRKLQRALLKVAEDWIDNAVLPGVVKEGDLIDDDMTAPVCEAVLQPKQTAKRRKWVRKKNGLFGWVSIGSRKK